jgi:hypothetical protein
MAPELVRELERELAKELEDDAIVSEGARRGR